MLADLRPGLRLYADDVGNVGDGITEDTAAAYALIFDRATDSGFFLL